MGVYEKSISKSQVELEVRKMSFPFEEVTSPWFMDNNPLKSTFFAALSATFPPGEAEFIDSVRLFQKQIDDTKLQKEIRAFIGQEAHHSLQHKRANQQLSAIGLDAVKLEKILEKHIEQIINSSRSNPAARLAITCGAEHLTAIMANYLLNNPEFLDGAPAAVQELLGWHAVEEIEHKSVAFDTYMATVGNRKLLHRSFIVMTIMFSTRISVYMMMLLWDNKKVPSVSETNSFLKDMFGKKGLVRNIAKPYLTYFKQNFHPWDHDDKALVDAWKAANSAS